jgi:phosphoethanolamine N-methyltransferase
MVAFLEWIWGRDFMAPGGEGNVDKLVKGLDLAGRRVLDIGCGIGGPAFVLARKYGAQVTGIDLEPQLIARAARRAAELGLSQQTDFRTVSLGPLPFPDRSFDLVFTSGALTQTADKTGMIAECFRVLKPGGVLTCYDWLKDDAPISDDMRYFFKMEGLSYNLITLAELGRQLAASGFVDVISEDASDWYRRESRSEYERMRGEGRTRAVELIGEAQAAHMIEDWRSMVVVCEKGELRQGYTRGRRPQDSARPFPITSCAPRSTPRSSGGSAPVPGASPAAARAGPRYPRGCDPAPRT